MHGSGLQPASTLDIPLTHWGNTLSRASRLSASPLDFDWSTDETTSPSLILTDSPSPTVRAARFRAQAAADVAATAEAVDTLQDGSQQVQEEMGRELDVLYARKDDHSDDGTDYFAFFSTPPIPFDPTPRPARANPGPDSLQHEEEGRLVPPDTRLEQTDVRPVLNQPAPDGDPRAFFHDQNRNARKRLWLGSPDPEDALRARRRLRRSNISPTEERREMVYNMEYGDGNPWESERRGREARSNTISDGPNCVFAPVTASTPTQLVRTMVDLSLASGHGPSSRTLSTTTSRAERSLAALPQSTPARDLERDPAPARAPEEASHGMNVDPRDGSPDEQRNTPRPDKGKGRARAQSQDPEEDAEEEEHSLEDPAEWSAAELQEARQLSMRHAQNTRTNARPGEYSRAPSQSLGAGPSGARNSYDQYDETRWDERRNLRDEPTSRYPPTREERAEYTMRYRDAPRADLTRTTSRLRDVPGERADARDGRE
ncbi:hypothetical protein K466DRAFT_571242, partial [Polyporus arcularius HHB13444]